MYAIIDETKQIEKYIAGEFRYLQYEDIMAGELNCYSCIFINGNEDGQPKKLPYAVIQKLWKYVESGGTLYGELINSEDFPSSRLIGLKQDFPVTNHRLDKLKVTFSSPYCVEGTLLEWQGPFISGFTFDTDVLLEIGLFQETHRSMAKGSNPGLIVNKVGKGMVIYAAFSFLANKQHWTLRPHWAWKRIIELLRDVYKLPLNNIEPVLGLSDDTEVSKVIERGISWFLNSGILPKEDGSLGVFENIHSIRGDVGQDIRPDCNAHTALLFYLYGEYVQDKKWITFSDNILNYLFNEGFQDTDEDSTTYGFWKWFKFPKEKPDQIFSDDNSWVALILLYLYRKTGNEEYKRRGLITAYALLETQNVNGLRPEVLREKDLAEKGREHYRQSTESSMNPHFESIVHAAFLQAYLVSDDRTFLDVSLKGTRFLLRNKERMKYMYSKTAGYSRFLLALAQLYSMTKDKEVYAGLKEIINYLSVHQHEKGGIQEADNPDPDRYGTEDTGVFLWNDEGIADQLYTNNFLIMNGNEAAIATQDDEVEEFYGKLVDYICAIQITSAKPEFEGGWMRSFHLHKDEYFGNNGDTGWGPYVIESGWTPAIILSGLILKELNQSLIDK